MSRVFTGFLCDVCERTHRFQKITGSVNEPQSNDPGTNHRTHYPCIFWNFCVKEAYVLGHRPFVLWSATQSTLLHLIESGQRVIHFREIHFRIYLAASVLCHVITKHQCHWRPCTLMPSHCSTMFHRWCCTHWIMSRSSYFFLPVILVQADLNFSRPKNAFPQVVWFF